MIWSDILSSPAGLWTVFVAGLVVIMGLNWAIWEWVQPKLRAREGMGYRIASRMRGPVRLLVLVIALGLLSTALPLPGNFVDSIEDLARVAMISAFGWMAILTVDFVTERSERKLDVGAEEKYGERAQATQLRVLRRILRILLFIITVGAVLSTFESVRQYGVSLFASAGVAGIVLGFAARPVLANLIAGIQIALTQPIRLNDVVIVEDEWGWIEEIGATYVVIRIWDLRRLVVPLSYFIERPFQNWTRDSSSLIGTVTWYLDYTVPMDAMREKLTEIAEASERWDGKTVVLQIIDTGPDTVEVRGLVSARNAPTAWDLRCEVREKMVAWLQAEHPAALPRTRAELQEVPARQVPRQASADDPEGLSDQSHIPEDDRFDGEDDAKRD